MTSTKIEIGVLACLARDLNWVQRLREWCHQNPLLQKLELEVRVERLTSLAQAIEWRSDTERPTRVVASIGFAPSDLCELAVTRATREEPVLLLQSNGSECLEYPSANFLETRPLLSCTDLLAQVRKSILRMALRGNAGISIRPPETSTELSSYFGLRYRVWKEAGFLNGRASRAKREFEVDCADRTALPLIALSGEDHSIIGCVRLVRTFGREERYFVPQIEQLIRETEDEELWEMFDYPDAMGETLPFDVLHEFPSFGERFKQLLVVERAEMAEVSRVAVDASFRGHCLSEALVDTAIWFAKTRKVSHLFLACHKVLSRLYSKCGFKAMEDLASDHFFNIQLPSIVMLRQLARQGC